MRFKDNQHCSAIEHAQRRADETGVRHVVQFHYCQRGLQVVPWTDRNPLGVLDIRDPRSKA